MRDILIFLLVVGVLTGVITTIQELSHDLQGSINLDYVEGCT
jgi:hypothetical protein